MIYKTLKNIYINAIKKKDFFVRKIFPLFRKPGAAERPICRLFYVKIWTFFNFEILYFYKHKISYL